MELEAPNDAPRPLIPLAIGNLTHAPHTSNERGPRESGYDASPWLRAGTTTDPPEKRFLHPPPSEGWFRDRCANRDASVTWPPRIDPAKGGFRKGICSMATLRPLWLSLGDLSERLRGAPVLNLAADYDGTLTPIVEHPDVAALSDRARQVIERMSRRDDVRVAIISGRNLDDLQ